jgi:hypothetical protein
MNSPSEASLLPPSIVSSGRPCQTAGSSSAPPISRFRIPFVNRPTHCQRRTCTPGGPKIVSSSSAGDRHAQTFPAPSCRASELEPRISSLGGASRSRALASKMHDHRRREAFAPRLSRSLSDQCDVPDSAIAVVWSQYNCCSRLIRWSNRLLFGGQESRRRDAEKFVSRGRIV